MTGGKNGSTPLQNLTQMRRKPVFEVNAEVERTKCPSHPTKRMWEDPIAAIREAEVRSTAAKMPIVAYRCDSCGNAHLCKRANAHSGSILEREAPMEPELPLVLGNADAKRKVLREFLSDRTEASTQELLALLDSNRGTVGRYMAEIDWYNTRGRTAKWIPRAQPALEEPPAAEIAPFVAPPRRLEAVETSKSRHPAAQQVGWEPMLMLDTIRHVPLGDVIDMLAAMGRELRIQTREKS